MFHHDYKKIGALDVMSGLIKLSLCDRPLKSAKKTKTSVLDMGGCDDPIRRQDAPCRPYEGRLNRPDAYVIK